MRVYLPKFGVVSIPRRQCFVLPQKQHFSLTAHSSSCSQSGSVLSVGKKNTETGQAKFYKKMLNKMHELLTI